MCTFVALTAVSRVKASDDTASVKAFDSVVDSDHSSGVRILLFLSQVVKDYYCIIYMAHLYPVKSVLSLFLITDQEKGICG